MQKVFISLLIILFFASSFEKVEKDTSKMVAPVLKETAASPIKEEPTSSAEMAAEVYNSIDFQNYKKLNADVFEKAFIGFQNLKKAGKLDEDSRFLTICDFSLSSVEKRLWVIDMKEQKVLYNTLVAHGKNTGEEFAQTFSNRESSYQSSLGFYITESTYEGANGYSLKLMGQDVGYNDAALRRAIVMHGADYVSENFIMSQKRLGRSWGCPAVPRELAKPIINTIKGKNGLFIYYPDSQYLSSSKWLKYDETV